ncbi:ABC transporter permease [Ohessyouella blattaphilus]|uniref:FtsX-like permease family protein n=1 Tax=Ohessyouella blattaphilus TaxID=2949333 RepID=A0ABT1EH77_9FIRM|nr:FtsX-like permease family protein [Ohessyouella blattaphilus]MCP1110062.1 FtsX-like permease family protein [Ohessyouella blattaphilus]MCR8563456.1 FtsX-like permease family protein [Ohessyouella blattaphilus]
MRPMDLLRISVTNLRRRKLRTFLTVLGVVIGTASIVTMISLGLGLQQSMLDEVEASGGLTSVNVTGKSAGETYIYYGNTEEEGEKYLTDDTLEKLKALEHVIGVAPLYEITGIFKKGNYEGYIPIIASTREGLEARKLTLKDGELPEVGQSRLDFVYGNTLLTNFYERGTDKGYYETGTVPNIDLGKDTLFLILDTDSYWASQDNSGSEGSSEEGDGFNQKQAKKYPVKSSGLLEGEIDDYSINGYYAYCDLESLKKVLKKEFTGKKIPGQPETKSGKPYKDFCYSSATLEVDDIDNVEAVVAAVRELGYNASTNQEYLESMQKQFFIIQAVLGGIGAVSLFVAAIGIANTMMMAIYERTKEIGVMKVLGCSLKSIHRMFLLEAAGIGFFGGFIGCVLSFILSAAINMLAANGGASMGISGNISYIPPWLVLLAMAFSMVVGVVAGILPASRGMKLSPLAAIRGE